MKITEVRVQYGRTVQPRPYESERIDIGLTATVGEDDDALVVTYELVEQARQSVGFHLDRLQRKRSGDLPEER